ncbi:MAG: hypothetical protein U1E81_22010 [Xanthobacteraceae bacterium]
MHAIHVLECIDHPGLGKPAGRQESSDIGKAGGDAGDDRANGRNACQDAPIYGPQAIAPSLVSMVMHAVASCCPAIRARLGCLDEDQLLAGSWIALPSTSTVLAQKRVEATKIAKPQRMFPVRHAARPGGIR